MKYLLLAFSSFLAIALQMITGNIFFLFNFLNISLILVAWWTIYHSRVRALFFGSFTGLLFDYALGWPLGYNGFGLTLAVFIIGQSWDRFNTTDQPVARFLILSASSLANSLSIFSLFWVTQRATSSAFLVSAVFQALITAGVGLLFFIILDRYKSAQAYRELGIRN